MGKQETQPRNTSKQYYSTRPLPVYAPEAQNLRGFRSISGKFSGSTTESNKTQTSQPRPLGRCLAPGWRSARLRDSIEGAHFWAKTKSLQEQGPSEHKIQFSGFRAWGFHAVSLLPESSASCWCAAVACCRPQPKSHAWSFSNVQQRWATVADSAMAS